MYYLHSIERTDAECIKSLINSREIQTCRSSDHLISLPITKKDTIIMDLAAGLPYEIQKEKGKALCFIVFYDANEFLNINPFLIYGNAVYIPRGSSKEDITNAMNLASVITERIDSLEESIIGSSGIMEKTRGRIRRAIDAGCTVHLSGETGTGKNIAAKEIHKRSGSRSEFIYESCGLLSSELAESSFFGHSKGAYSGATEEREGLLGRADGNTFFLDEIEDMSLGMQSKLLHVLETGEYRQLGKDKMLKSAFRLITASNIDLKELLRENKLRKDFYYRLSPVMIRMPSLAEHKEDIPELISHFEASIGIHPNDRILDYTSFMDYDYPGNVRELFSMIMLHHLGIDEEEVH